jgi:hypothetical protein
MCHGLSRVDEWMGGDRGEAEVGGGGGRGLTLRRNRMWLLGSEI